MMNCKTCRYFAGRKYGPSVEHYRDVAGECEQPQVKRSVEYQELFQMPCCGREWREAVPEIGETFTDLQSLANHLIKSGEHDTEVGIIQGIYERLAKYYMEKMP